MSGDLNELARFSTSFIWLRVRIAPALVIHNRELFLKGQKQKGVWEDLTSLGFDSFLGCG